MKRAFILLLDSFGIGNAPDAKQYGDYGSDTLGHIVDECFKGNADTKKRKGPLQLPNLAKHGLEKAAEASRNKPLAHNLGKVDEVEGAYGYGIEISKGKDTCSGHWEIAGVPVMFEWGYFENKEHCFPKELIDDFIREAKLPGVLCEAHASGTVIINELGDEHCKTGKPIVYSSADSVFQVAAHEKYFGLERLLEICDIARKLVDKYNIGRVIARPFIGEGNGNYERTGNRHDIAVPPPGITLLDKLKNSGGNVVSIGKIVDIFANSGITKKIKATDLETLFNSTLNEIQIAEDNTIIFTNFVDFDAVYGHRRNTAGYAEALEYFDGRLPEIEKLLKPGDIVVIAADHGCDPTWEGTDHTREHIPILMFGPEVKTVFLEGRSTFADIGQTLAKYFNLEPFEHGTVCDIL